MAFRELLSREIVHGPVAAALAARPLLLVDIEPAIVLVDDPNEDTAWRVAALLAIALAAQDGTPLPERVLDLLEDDVLVDAAIAARADAAITGILAAAGPAGERMRTYLAIRLAAAGATGLHIAALLFSVGDLSGAGRAALPALVKDVRASVDDVDLLSAIASIVAAWTQAQPEFGERLCATLPADVAHALAPAARVFDERTAALLDAAR